ncbi:MAG: hypothetical protein KC777_10280 [Cyanobacteria bacterium HKST-UBA02]|nr:hypothetical protein [Cyanobacteria bacterium HKST-UBA02]
MADPDKLSLADALVKGKKYDQAVPILKELIEEGTHTNSRKDEPLTLAGAMRKHLSHRMPLELLARCSFHQNKLDQVAEQADEIIEILEGSVSNFEANPPSERRGFDSQVCKLLEEEYNERKQVLSWLRENRLGKK